MSWKSKSLIALPVSVLLLCVGCASSGVAKMVTVNGKHVLAQSCTDERRLAEAMTEVQDRRRPLAEEISDLRTELGSLDARLELSSIAEREPGGEFACSPHVEIKRKQPQLALPEEEAGTLGWIVCSALELGPAVACARAEERFVSLGGLACESMIKEILGADRDDLIADFGAHFLHFLGDLELEQGQTGSGTLAHGLALLIQAQQFQSCVGKVARASSMSYQAWSFEQSYLGREDELVALCHGWRAEHARLRHQLAPLQDQNQEMERELADLRAEHREVQAEIRRAGLRCQ